MREKSSMNNSELQVLVNDLSVAYFGKPFIDVAVFNPRLRTTGGRYLPGERRIEINSKYLEELGITEVMGIIKHELCHYHLHITGKDFGHGSQAFKDLLKKTDAPRHCQPLPSELKKSATWHKYMCQDCNQMYKRKRKVDVIKYRCGRCRGKLKRVG